MKEVTLDKQIWTRVDADTQEKMKAKCKELGITASAAVRILIIKFIKGEITL